MGLIDNKRIRGKAHLASFRTDDGLTINCVACMNKNIVCIGFEADEEEDDLRIVDKRIGVTVERAVQLFLYDKLDYGLLNHMKERVRYALDELFNREFDFRKYALVKDK